MRSEELARVQESTKKPRLDWDGTFTFALLKGTGLWFVLLLAWGLIGKAVGFDPRDLRPDVDLAGMMGMLVVGVVGAYWYDLAKQYREDLEAGRKRNLRYAADRESRQIEEWRVGVREAIEIEEFEDEGAQYYLELEDGRVLFLMGQYLYDDQYDGRFPNRELLVTRLPHAGDILNLQCVGEPLPVSATLAGFTSDEYESGAVPEDGAIFDGPLSRFKNRPVAAET